MGESVDAVKLTAGQELRLFIFTVICVPRGRGGLVSCGPTRTMCRTSARAARSDPKVVPARSSAKKQGPPRKCPAPDTPPRRLMIPCVPFVPLLRGERNGTPPPSRRSELGYPVEPPAPWPIQRVLHGAQTTPPSATRARVLRCARTVVRLDRPKGSMLRSAARPTVRSPFSEIRSGARS